MTPALEEEIAAQDAALARLGLEIWTGAEPTFTDRGSQEPWWLGQALGGDKEERARALAVDLARHAARAARVFAVEGRQFPDEPEPRFAYAVSWRREDEGGEGDGVVEADFDSPPRAAPMPAPADEAWAFVVPDPGVLEIALPPAPSLAVFARYVAAAHAAAVAAGLSPLRWRWNGEELDSGGGGQLTFGGSTPESSPFFAKPRLLPGLLRYLNRHPALSFAFAAECVGGASQGPRPDEGSRERFDELGLALDLLGAEADPPRLSAALGPLLVDGSGNSHRAEVNVEKLWNPALPGRGLLGLVELRALRMEPTPERATAVAALFRALLARLCVAPFESPLFDWGQALHDRFGLPSVLLRDLGHVIDDLDENDLRLGPHLREMALAAPAPIADVVLGTGQLVLTPAIEFWPLVGDVASQERQPSRVVDSSTRRVEIRIRVPPGESPGLVHAEGRSVALHPLARETEAHVHVGAVRFRSFAPNPGFHPGLAAVDPLVIEWSRGGHGRRIELHSWIPGGGAYDSLPMDGAEAARRRRERVRITACEPQSAATIPFSDAWTLDLRRRPA